MIKLNKILVLCAILVLLILPGCAKKTDEGQSFDRTGTEGITASFIPGQPPEKIYAELNSNNRFDIVLELRNKGNYPESGKGSGASGLGPKFGTIYLSGFDKNIITNLDQPKEGSRNDLSAMALEGKSQINPNGGQDIAGFTGAIDRNKLNVNVYEPILSATLCYYYETVTGPSVCIDPQPYSAIEKVCQAKDLSMTSQGAPIAITRIDEETFATKTQFRITVKNVGNGQVAEGTEGKCAKPTVQRDDIDKLKVEYVKASTTELSCGPFIDTNIKGNSGLIRLISGEGSIICELPSDLYSNYVNAYTTPLSIKLSYSYRTSTQRNLRIVKE